jgi:hypothetical protein
MIPLRSWELPAQAHSAVHDLQTAVRERPAALLTQGCAATLARLYELGEARVLTAVHWQFIDSGKLGTPIREQLLV